MTVQSERLNDWSDESDHCRHCGRGLPDDDYWGRRMYCSRDCAVAAQARKDKDARLAEKAARPRSCRLCGGQIAPYKPGYTVFCSLACQRIWHNNNQPYKFQATCQTCSTTFDAIRPGAKYCSLECVAAGKMKTRKPCEQCGSPVRSYKPGTRFCSTECYGKSMRGRAERRR